MATKPTSPRSLNIPWRERAAGSDASGVSCFNKQVLVSLGNLKAKNLVN